MTWNVENLFDVGDEDGPESEAQLAAKIESLRAVIDDREPHVLALQEIGSESALARLQGALNEPMPHREVAEPDERGIRVAFISRRVLRDRIEIGPFPDGLLPVQVGDDPEGPDGPRLMNQMGRPALQVTVRANNRDVHLVTAHMKSKLLTFPGGSFTPADEDQRVIRHLTGFASEFRRSAQRIEEQILRVERLGVEPMLALAASVDESPVFGKMPEEVPEIRCAEKRDAWRVLSAWFVAAGAETAPWRRLTDSLGAPEKLAGVARTGAITEPF